MFAWMNQILDKSEMFMPHGHCYLWLPGLLWLHVMSDLLIGLAYVGISLVLYLLVRKIRLPFSPLFVAFGLFIGLCGLTHFVQIWTIWVPDYWLDGLVKAATASASVATAVGLFYAKPKVEELVHAARLSQERKVKLESTVAELDYLYHQLKEADQLKTQFFANVSHELRTPLALILGPVEKMIDDGGLDETQIKSLRGVASNARSLLNQVNELLDVARLSEGRLQASYARVDVPAQLRSLITRFDASANQRGLQLEFEAPETLVAEVDAEMLERIAINLLSNALKFTERGGVSVKLAGTDDNLTIQVADTGPGISEAQQKTVFDRFHQVSESQYPGSGLGLAIAKDFTELLHGRIDLHSVPDEGSVFTVTLPLKAPSQAVVTDFDKSRSQASQMVLTGALDELDASPDNAAVPAESAQASAEAGHVLVVEDNVEMANFISSVLARDYRVATASNGAEGLAQAMALAPDLIVSDIMMPQLTGDELVRAVRKEPLLANVPILLLTAFNDEELRVRLLREGAQDFLTKPFLAPELAARVANLIRIKRAGDTLREELSSVSGDVEALALELAAANHQLKSALEANEVALERAESASRVKSQFLALVSHEFRTPLATINMSAQLLNHREATRNPGVRVQTERMLRAAGQLTNLVEGLLEYTRLESGRIKFDIRAIPLNDVLDEVEQTSGIQRASSDVALIVIKPDAIAELCSDRRLLTIVLNNLLGNALKFTPQGKVSLQVSAGDGWHRFDVVDTGIGIAAADIPRIFMPFEQLEPLQRKSIPGVGLGLALTKDIVESLGGRIEVKSEPKKGSCFTVWLPSNPQVSG